VSISLTFNFSKAYTTVAIMPEKEEMKMKAIHSEHISKRWIRSQLTE
jgi:S-ribosylhomocysteine lyase LuxS involved in autoinducer biosynthesis